MGSCRALIVRVVVLWALAGCGPPPADHAAAVDWPDTVTFAAHIAPIVHTHCTPCHRPGHAGPFPLITYPDVRRRARMVRYMTEHRYMPPWPADTAYSRFLGERVLNARQIGLIARWVDQGMLPGDLQTIPAPDELLAKPSPGEEPDAVVWMPDTFHIPGDDRDRFVITKAPFELERDTFLRAVAFIPGNQRAVHHMNAAMVNYARGARSDVVAGFAYIDADRTNTPDAYMALGLQNDDGSWPALTPNVVNHLPGMHPMLLPEGIGGYRIAQKGAFLMNTIHYGPSPVDTFDRSRFHLWFMDRRPERPMHEIQIGTRGLTPVEPELVIPPDTVMTFTSRFTLPAAISVVSVNPHMHLLGRSFLAYAVTPTHDTIPLIRINDWDFRWQYTYTFRHLLPIPAGSTIHVFGTFDNTRHNPNNPFDPPRTAFAPRTGHMRTTDEMFQFFVNFLDFRPGDDTISLAPAGRGR
jgi:hypothetical protein